jgi:hypothetical protein
MFDHVGTDANAIGKASFARSQIGICYRQQNKIAEAVCMIMLLARVVRCLHVLTSTILIIVLRDRKPFCSRLLVDSK